MCLDIKQSCFGTQGHYGSDMTGESESRRANASGKKASPTGTHLPDRKKTKLCVNIYCQNVTGSEDYL